MTIRERLSEEGVRRRGMVPTQVEPAKVLSSPIIAEFDGAASRLQVIEVRGIVPGDHGPVDSPTLELVVVLTREGDRYAGYAP